MGTTARPTPPEFLTSAVHAELLAAFLDDAADRYATMAGEAGLGLVSAATVRMARADARAIREAAGVAEPTKGERDRAPAVLHQVRVVEHEDRDEATN